MATPTDLPQPVLDAMMTSACITCAEIRAGLNQRQWMDLWDASRAGVDIEPILPWMLQRSLPCTLCNRAVCGFHRCDSFRYRPVGRFQIIRRDVVNSCAECRSLHVLLAGLGRNGHRRERVSFRKRWHLFKWRLTKRRLVERLRISRVVVGQLPKDLADLVATYAVK